MNITDVSDDAAKVDGDRLRVIFDRQRELIKKYHEIEIASGVGYAVLDDRPFDVDAPRGQALCKDFAWRIVEELGEALEAIEDPVHAQEEIADALHFLVELLLINGIDEERIFRLATNGHGRYVNKDMLWNLFEANRVENEISTEKKYYSVGRFVEAIGTTMNCLKQKPWKQTHVLTDVNRFHDGLGRSLKELIRVAIVFGMTDDRLFEFYFKKSEVNKFRQRSNY